MGSSNDKDLKLFRIYVRNMLESLAVDDDDPEEVQDESSGAGAVAGFVLPLGMTPSDPKVKTQRRSKKNK